MGEIRLLEILAEYEYTEKFVEITGSYSLKDALMYRTPSELIQVLSQLQ